jgi:hypothetical protein
MKQFLSIIFLLTATNNLVAQNKTNITAQAKIEGLWHLSKVITYNSGKNKTSTLDSFYINFNSSSDAVFHNHERIFHVIRFNKIFKNKVLIEIGLNDSKDTFVFPPLAKPEDVLFMNGDDYHQEVRNFKIIELTKTTLVFKCISNIDHLYFTFYFNRAKNQNLTSEFFDE